MAKITDINIADFKVRNQTMVEKALASKALAVVGWLSNGSDNNEPGLRLQLALVKNGKFQQVSRSKAGKMSQYFFGRDDGKSNAGIATRMSADSKAQITEEVPFYSLNDDKLTVKGEIDITFTPEGSKVEANGGTMLTSGFDFNITEARAKEDEAKRKAQEERANQRRTQKTGVTGLPSRQTQTRQNAGASAEYDS